MNKEVIKELANSILKDETFVEEDLFLVDVKVSKSNVIEIFIDSLVGVNLQTCINVSKRIEENLDREKEDFELTVASAGIGYPFKVDGQFQKCLGKDVEILFVDSSKKIATLITFTDESVDVSWTEKQLLEGKKRKEEVLVEKTFLRSEIKEIKEYIKF